MLCEEVMVLHVAPSLLGSQDPHNVVAHQPHWFAAYTYPRHEKAVADVLARKSVEIFLPTVHKISQWKDRRVSQELPLFPSYVFARICAGEKAKVLSMPSVIRILSLRGVPIPVSDDEIDAVRLCIQHGAKLEKYGFLTVGDRVQVKRGVFEGLEGIVVRHNNGCKLIVSVSLIQQSVALEIDADLLERVAPSSSSMSCGRRNRVEVA
jgi:transcription antitermination factor NusG